MCAFKKGKNKFIQIIILKMIKYIIWIHKWYHKIKYCFTLHIVYIIKLSFWIREKGINRIYLGK